MTRRIVAPLFALLVIACQDMMPEESPPRFVDLEARATRAVWVEGRYFVVQQFSVPEITQAVLEDGGVYAKVRAGNTWIDLPYSAFESCYYTGGDNAVCGVTYAVAYGVGTATYSAVGVTVAGSDLLDIEGTRIRLFFR
jgi:hypothetical protein